MDAIKSYLKQLRPIPLLTAQEEIDLARLIQKGDKKAREKMIRSNLRLVVTMAKRYINMGIPLSDLIEEGNLGLIRSVEKYDPERGFRFSTYATWWIKQGISRSIIDQGKLIRVPVYMNEGILKYKKMVDKMTQTMKRKPTFGEVAKRMRTSAEKIRELENATAKMSSFEAPIGESGEGQVKDIVEDQNLIAADEQLEMFLNKERALSFLEVLGEREKTIIVMRFGLNDGDPKTLSDIAKTLGISRERVRQIEATTLEKIRFNIKKNKGNDEIEEMPKKGKKK